MAEIYTTGTWRPASGKEDTFMEAWAEFAAWASGRDGAGTLTLTRDTTDTGRFVSFGLWEDEQAVRAWKSRDEFREGLARVLQHVDDFHPAELEVCVTATAGASSTAVTA
jgi:heme-degrading monooxygenase HmoA